MLTHKSRKHDDEQCTHKKINTVNTYRNIIGSLKHQSLPR